VVAACSSISMRGNEPNHPLNTAATLALSPARISIARPDLGAERLEQSFLGCHSIEPSALRAHGPPQYRNV
jgi:hypothetical protein